MEFSTVSPSALVWSISEPKAEWGIIYTTIINNVATITISLCILFRLTTKNAMTQKIKTWRLYVQDLL